MRRPFWLPASSYYVLSVSVSVAFFFIVWGILHDEGEEVPIVTAGIGACIVLGGAVILREIVIRRRGSGFPIAQRTISVQMSGANYRIGHSGDANKLTLEKNAAVLSEIKRKSDAANTLTKLSAGHREVFELCSEYITRNESELRNVSPNSPRLPALLRGRSAVAEFHRFHMLKWAEIEARTLTGEAKNKLKSSERIEAAQQALDVIESALESYPSEPSLLQSHDLLGEMLVSIKVSDLIEKAESASSRGNFTKGKGLYIEALHCLGRDNVQNSDRDEAARQINVEIEKIRKQENGE